MTLKAHFKDYLLVKPSVMIPLGHSLLVPKWSLPFWNPVAGPSVFSEVYITKMLFSIVMPIKISSTISENSWGITFLWSHFSAWLLGWTPSSLESIQTENSLPSLVFIAKMIYTWEFCKFGNLMGKDKKQSNVHNFLTRSLLSLFFLIPFME